MTATSSARRSCGPRRTSSWAARRAAESKALAAFDQRAAVEALAGRTFADLRADAAARRTPGPEPVGRCAECRAISVLGDSVGALDGGVLCVPCARELLEDTSVGPEIEAGNTVSPGALPCSSAMIENEERPR